MNIVEKLGLKLLHKTDPENAHNLAIKALKYGMIPKRKVYTSKRLRQNIAGLDLLPWPCITNAICILYIWLLFY